MRAIAVGGLLVVAAGAALLAGCGGGGTTTVTVTTESTASAPVARTFAPVGTETAPPTDTAPVTETAPVETAPATETAPGTETSPPTTSLIERPTGAESALLSQLRPEVAARCTRESSSNRTPSARAGLYCDLRPTDRIQAYYESFGSRDQTEVVYAGWRRRTGVPSSSGGRCVPLESLPAETTWRYGNGPIEGRIVCYRGGSGRFWIVWSDPRHRAMGWIRAARYADAADFWRSTGLLVN
jgi:hypothetical protein